MQNVELVYKYSDKVLECDVNACSKCLSILNNMGIIKFLNFGVTSFLKF
jgi:hypothetical protein